MVKSKTLLFFLAACFVFATSSPAQIGKMLDGMQGKTPEPAAPVEPEPDIREKLIDWRKETSVELARLRKTDPRSDLPVGIQAADHEARIRTLELTQTAISRHLVILDGVASASEELKEVKAEKSDWKGFPEKPPYSILLVDQLVNRQEAVKEKAASNQSSIDIFKSTLDIILAESSEAETTVTAATKTYEAAAEEDKDTALWELNSARDQQRVLFIRASSLKHNISSLENLKAAADIESAWLSKQIEEARKDTRFDQEDMETIRKASEDRQEKLRQEIRDVRKRLAAAISRRDAAEAEVGNLSDRKDGGEELVLARLRLEAAATQVESMQTMSDAYESYEQIESFVPDAYEQRRVLVNSKNAAERAASLKALISLNQRLEAWEVVAQNELAAVSADISKEEARSAAMPADDPRLVPLIAQRASLWEKQALIQRAYQTVLNQRKVLRRWIAEYSTKEYVPWYATLGDGFNKVREKVRSVWQIPVNQYEKKIQVDGETVSQIRYVSLGDIIVALLVFIVAYLLAAWMSRRIQRLLVGRSVIGENQAKTLRNWVMLLVSLLLALVTLNWLSIPLTIFAFLAGALAIGIGFGTQTMIKNFMSGIILLFERKVRVGDIIEVDGTLGVVSEINTRSSIVRGFNGIENLIPNSLFLENKVVNWTLNSSFLRRELELGVTYGSSPQKIIEILTEAAGRHGLILKDPPPFAVFEAFADNSLNFRLYYWVELNEKTNSLVVGSDLRIMIDKKLSESGIGVPFPQRDIHLDTSGPMQVELTRKPRQKPTEAGAKAPVLP